MKIQKYHHLRLKHQIYKIKIIEAVTDMQDKILENDAINTEYKTNNENI